jgi:hypothetical protein
MHVRRVPDSSIAQAVLLTRGVTDDRHLVRQINVLVVCNIIVEVACSLLVSRRASVLVALEVRFYPPRKVNEEVDKDLHPFYESDD